MSLIKRIIDIILSLTGLLFVIPFLPIIGLLIKLDSRGPIFYLADRIGKDMKIFKMYKFRTMLDTPIEAGQSVSPQYDPRVTTFGRFLRRTKMNELPQFINVLKGEMTFVGPRPEAPDLAELYPEEAKRIFSVKPGLVGPNAILGRNEEEFYPPGVDAKTYYIEKMLPQRVKRDLEYLDNQSLFKDLKYISMAVKETLVGMLSQRHFHHNRSQIYLLLCDLFITIFSFALASLLSIRMSFEWFDFNAILLSLPIILSVRLVCNIYFGMYSSLIRYISYHEIRGVAKGTICGSILLALIFSILGWPGYWGLTAVLDMVTLLLLLCAFRFTLRFYWDQTHRKADERQRHRILIYGAGDGGYAAYRVLASEKYWPFDVIGFIDDSPDKYGKALNGKKVLGNRYHIGALARLYRVDEILIAETGSDPERIRELMRICQQSGLKYRVFPSFQDFDSVNGNSLSVRNLEISDILPLKRFHADQYMVKEILAGKTVLVNGASGALGLELCRRILHMGCRKLIIVEHYESYLNELIAALLADFSPKSLVPILTGPDAIASLEQEFENYQPSIVFHAGMRKYLPFLDVDLSDIGRNNYLRTFHLAKTAAMHKCEIFVMISSLMASQGGNFIADSLRIAELSLEHFFSDTQTQLVISRLCDIAENRGGMLALIEEQIRNREAVILPSRDATAHFISKHSAADFILQALAEAKRHNYKTKLFAWDAGSPVSLIEIARKMAYLYGLRPDLDLAIKYRSQSVETGLRSADNHVSTTPFLLPAGEFHNLGTNVTPEILKSVFKNFVNLCDDKAAFQDWKVRTWELLGLCAHIPR
jgi:FlaA1/EpsC-like NDP-sugar epimerase/lipopolysaccharide/colanic/teichoic acid biosynthesis glycosyltransferase